ncbi:MAG: FG-GAP repeat domain-containing protein [bacterium]
MKRVLVFTCMIVLLHAPVSAVEKGKNTIFNEISRDALSFFVPVTGLITSLSEGTAEIDIGQTGGVRKGMRFKAFREGSEFFHPVTGEALGRIETGTGEVEVIEADDQKATVRIISGDIEIGDRVRISQGVMQVLFYQTRSVDWVVGDSLFRDLKNTGRFEMMETEYDKDDPAVMIREMQEKNAVFGIFLRGTKHEGKEALAVSFYHPDGNEFYHRDIVLMDEQVKELKFGYDYLKKVDTATTRWSFEVPSSMEFIAACDVNGDGKDELVAAIGDEVEVFRLDEELKTLFTADIRHAVQAIWLDCADIDRDGKAEIVVSSLADGRAVSDIFTYSGTELKRVEKKNGFLRVLDNTLYGQAFSSTEGFAGKVHALQPGNGWSSGKELELPQGMSLYDSYPVTVNGQDGYLFIDDGAFINIVLADGKLLWRNPESLGGFLREYKKESPTGLLDAGSWFVKDRVLPYAGSLLLIKRNLVAKTSKGLGFSSADIIELSFPEGVPTVSPVLKEISGTVYDFAVIEDKLVILVRQSLAMKAVNVFKGKSPFKREIYLFPLKKD